MAHVSTPEKDQPPKGYSLPPTLEKNCLEEDEEMTSNFSGSDPSFNVVCVVSVLSIEYDVPSEVSDVESDFTEEMAIHRSLCTMS